jgi:MFS transporter, FHS family, glucose/mannose:H+ symporter
LQDGTNTGASPAAKKLLPLSVGLLYLGGVLSGSLTVLLGCVLPRLSALDHLSDRQAGTLLMVQFSFCACGALLVRRNFHQTLARGYALIALAALALHLLPKPFAMLSIAGYGLGLGMVMTSNSMIVGRIFTARRGIALAVLNLCWSLGATLSPLLVARVFGRFSVAVISLTVALFSASFVVITLLSRFRWIVEDQRRVITPSESPTRTLAYFGLLAFLYVGIESATGNWMSTYASRVVAWDYARSNLATACFWSALLLGRTVAPLILLRLAEEKLFLLSVFGSAAGVCLLVAAHSAWFLLVGAAVAGLSLAPIFPLTLSLFMAKAGQPRNSGWVFAVAGFGGAVLSWLTGIVSSSAGSLRIGLLVPAAAALLLLLMAFRLPSGGGAFSLKPLPPKAAPGRA